MFALDCRVVWVGGVGWFTWFGLGFGGVGVLGVSCL